MSPRSICSNPFLLASNNTNSTNHTCDKDSSFTTTTTTNQPTKDNNNNTNNTTTTITTMAKDHNNDDIPRTRTEPRPDFSKPLPRSKLPLELQETLDNEEKLWSTVYDGQGPESTDSSLRYAGYASRIRTILLSAHRYVAYTSDIGESFRPVAHPYLIKGAYGVSWAYLAGDVGHEGYKAYLRNQRALHPETASETETALGASVVQKASGADVAREGGVLPSAAKLGLGDTAPSGGSGEVQQGKVVPIEDYRAVMAQRAIFQGVASMGLPAFTIHSIVKYAGKALKDTKNLKLRSYGPIGVSRDIHTVHLFTPRTLMLILSAVARSSSRTSPPLHVRRASRARHGVHLLQRLQVLRRPGSSRPPPRNRSLGTDADRGASRCREGKGTVK